VSAERRNERAVRWRRWWRLRRQRPQARRLFGISQRREQPACTLAQRSVISLY